MAMEEKGSFAEKFKKALPVKNDDAKNDDAENSSSRNLRSFSDKFQKKTTVSVAKKNSDTNSTILERTMKSNTNNFRIVKGMADFVLSNGDIEKRAAWHIVYLTDAVTFDRLIRRNVEKIDVQEYGKIIESGWGEEPSKEILSKIRKQFDIEDSDNTEEDK